MKFGLCKEMALVTAALIVPAIASATFQYEVLGVSSDWIVVRENIPATPSDTDACPYPGMDPSEQVGAVVYFSKLSAEAKRGQLTVFDTHSSSMTLYSPARHGEGCTTPADAASRWHAIALRAKSLGVDASSSVPAAVMGEAVPDKDCVLIGGEGKEKSRCRSSFTNSMKGETVRIALSLAAVPESPDERSCQFVGNNFSAAIQVTLSGSVNHESAAIAPGGFAQHYDCRSQQFDPLRLYRLGEVRVLLGSFRGTNIADRREYPFLIIFPTTVPTMKS